MISYRTRHTCDRDGTEEVRDGYFKPDEAPVGWGTVTIDDISVLLCPDCMDRARTALNVTP
jgi:hypothetical protein